MNYRHYRLSGRDQAMVSLSLPVDGGANMSSINRDRPGCVGVGASRICHNERKVPSVAVRQALRLVAIAWTAATLANCAQSPVVTGKPASLAAGREASPEHNRKTSFVANRHVAAVTRKHAPGASNRQAAETQNASDGLASFYGQGSQTASGERFNARELTAAHRTLPGTRVRVTNLATGQSVTVRVTDRGPFIPGRVVEVSRSAASEALGIVERGVAKVKLDVVQ
jgi:peptidoglycan lytic transglycosylase